MMAAKAPIDGYGIGVNLDASIDAPSLDCAYKLQEYAGTPRRKLSEGKVTWPGRKQVWRASDSNGCMASDVLSLDNDTLPGEALVAPVMRHGKRIATAPSLLQIREHAARNLASLPEPLRRLEGGADYRVTISDKLKDLAARADAKGH
jgi:nicotinate phosphoribosyltransferase